MLIRRSSTALVVCLTCMLFQNASSQSADRKPEASDRSQYYGFKPLEIFKLELRSANMLSGDLNNDGRADLILVDNSHSRLDLLLQQTKAAIAKSAGNKKRPVNFIGNSSRFHHQKVAVDKQVAALTIGDFNGDGRTDIAYFGVPDRLVIRYQRASGAWTERFSLRLPDVQAVQWILAAGDLNHDGKHDLAVLGKNEIYLIYQQPDGKLAPPKRLMNTSEKLALLQIADLDGDGRNDLCYLAAVGSDRTLCARLQSAEGRLGPELRFELNRTRSVSLANIDNVPGREILTIESQTGRLKVHRLRRPVAKPGELASRLIQYGFGRQGSGRDRDLAIGDINGDGLLDVVVTDPDAAQLIVFQQHPKTGLDLGLTFPGLVGANHIRIADFDGDKSAEVIVLSTREKTLGLSRMRAGRLTFPRALPVEAEPMAVELADVDKDGAKEIVYISRKREGRESNYWLNALKFTDGGWKPHSIGKQGPISLELNGTPDRLIQLDANNDGRPDFMIFLGLDRAPQLFTTNEAGIPTEVKAQGGIQLGDVSAGSIFVGQLDQPVVLVAQEKFARNLQLDENQQWQVNDQYNAVESNAKIVGVAAINLDGQPGNEIVLVDSVIKKLRVLRRSGALFEPWREIDTGTFPYKSTHVADLNNDGLEDLLLFGNGKFAVLYTGRTDPKLEEIASFESKLDKVFFADVVAGDLNRDGRTNLALIDTRSHFIEIVEFQPGSKPKIGQPIAAKLQHALHFKVFEEKSFRGGEGSGSEPRESVIIDVTDDQRNDLILLTHDRVLIYPQDDGN